MIGPWVDLMPWFIICPYFFFGFEDILRDTESSYMIKGGIIIGLLVFDITTTTACWRIFGQMNTSDWIRFMSIASYTASGSTQF